MKASDVLNRITKAKRGQVETLRYVLEHDEQLGQKIRFCGSWLHFREWIESGESRVVNANFCKRTLICRACAIRRAGKLVDGYSTKVEQVQKELPDLKPVVMTLTVKNGPDLDERFTHLAESWTSMIAAARKAKSSPAKNLPIEWNKVAGSVRACEVTKAKNGEWHPHMHVFGLLSDYIDHEKLVEEWNRFTGDSFIVGITACKNGVLPGLIETLKYSTKFSDLEPADVLHVHRILKSKRLVDPSGVLRGVNVGDLDEDDLQGLTGPYRDYIARWMESQMSYDITLIPTIPDHLRKLTHTSGTPMDALRNSRSPLA